MIRFTRATRRWLWDRFRKPKPIPSVAPIARQLECERKAHKPTRKTIAALKKANREAFEAEYYRRFAQ